MPSMLSQNAYDTRMSRTYRVLFPESYKRSSRGKQLTNNRCGFQ